MYFVGLGKDIHKLVKTKSTIVLGGYKFKANHKIVAFSDGDVILHSIADAILGACQANDIGVAFPDDNAKFKNINSHSIISYALKIMKNKKLSINNLDITIVCDKIMVNPIRKNILNSLQKILKTKLINIKATRFEENKNLIECDSIILLKGAK